MLSVTPYQIAQRFVGLKEVSGNIKSNPLILAMLQLDTSWPPGDETPWCSAFTNFVCHLLGLPRSRSLAARSWLDVGRPVDLQHAKVGPDLVVLSRGAGGHVGFYAGHDASGIHILGGNQGDAVSLATFSPSRLLGIRRLYELA